MDRRQRAGAEEAHELGGVTAIGLHTLPWLTRRQGGGDHGTVHAERRELPIEVVARHAGFITGADGRLLEPVALFRPGTIHVYAIGQAGPSIWSRRPGLCSTAVVRSAAASDHSSTGEAEARRQRMPVRRNVNVHGRRSAPVAAI